AGGRADLALQADVPRLGGPSSRRQTMSTPGSATPALSLRGVSKRFGAVQAVRDVSLDCRRGEVHAVVGENGSGKSTLLGGASGVLVPNEGTVEINGQRLQHG